MKLALKILAAGMTLFVSSSMASAQTAIDSFAESISGKFVEFDYSFKTRGEIPVMGEGHVCFIENEFRMAGNGLEICSDGISRWTVDRAEKEIYIEAVDPSELNFMANPALLLTSVKASFIQKRVSDATFSGKKVKAVTLFPSVQGTGLETLTLFLSGNCPVGASVVLQEGTETVFDFDGYHTGARPSGYSFAFDMSSLDKSYLVTDLR